MWSADSCACPEAKPRSSVPLLLSCQPRSAWGTGLLRWRTPSLSALLSPEQPRRAQGTQRRAHPLSSVTADVRSSSGSWLSEERGEGSPAGGELLPSHKHATTGCLGSNTEAWPGAGLTGKEGQVMPEDQGCRVLGEVRSLGLCTSGTWGGCPQGIPVTEVGLPCGVRGCHAAVGLTGWLVTL